MQATEVFGKRALGNISTTDYSLWAIACLVEGSDAMNLCELAASNESSGLNAFELGSLFSDALKELHLEEPKREECLVNFSVLLASQLAEDTADYVIKISYLYGIYIALDYSKDYLVWSELDDAIKDIENNRHPYAFEEATKENIESIILREAKKFLRLQRGT